VQYLEAVAGANLLRLEANQSYEWRRP
jgi:hypothetical protein